MRKVFSGYGQPLVYGAVLAGLLVGCGSPSTPPTKNASCVTVYVNDGQYNTDFKYESPCSFAYATQALPGYTQTADEARVLALVNAERQKGGVCPVQGGGFVSYAPSKPLTFEGHLHKAAHDYAQELASSGTRDLPHRSVKTGLVPSQRMVEAGYVPAVPNRSQLVFRESLAAAWGDPSGEEVIKLWKNSPLHCAALYEPMATYSHGAVAQVNTVIGGQQASYWVLNTAGY